MSPAHRDGSLALIARWYRSRSRRALSTAAQIAGMIALGVIAVVVATGGYEFVVDALGDPGSLPATLSR